MKGKQPLSPTTQGQGRGRGRWSTGLFDCFDDVNNCCVTFWCPWFTFGQIAEILDRGSTSCGVSGALYGLVSALTGAQCIYSCAYRSKMRRLYSLKSEEKEAPYRDFLVHCCCERCALCQMHRELTNRGFDMEIGWQMNMEKQAAMAVPPSMQAGMSR